MAKPPQYRPIPPTFSIAPDEYSKRWMQETIRQLQDAFNAVYGQTFVTTGLPKAATGLKSGALWIDSSGFLRVVPLLILLFAASCRPKSTPGESALATADSFVDSIGVNTHFSYTDSIYHLNFPLAKQALLDLKIRRIRDGIHTVPPDIYDLHNQLGSAGLKCLFVTDRALPVDTLLNYPVQVSDFEAYEDPNEADVKGGSAWVEPLKEDMLMAHDAASHSQLPVIGPSLINATWWDQNNSFQQLGNIAEHVSHNNLHNYFGAYHPETKGWGGGCDANGYCYGSIVWNMGQAQISGPGLSTWTTENGYTINASKPSAAVPETVYATYLPRMLLAQWNAGILRTYIYELADDPSTACCMGLMDDKGNRRKPFNALKNLISLLSDKGSVFTPVNLTYTIDGAPASLNKTLLAKRDKTYWLCLWLGVASYDPQSYIINTVTPVNVTVTWQGKSGGSRIYKFDQNGGMTDIGRKDGNSNTVSVDDKLLILKIAMS